VSIENAVLERPVTPGASTYTRDIESAFSHRNYFYDVGHSLFYTEWSAYITRYITHNSISGNLGMDGVVVDNLPMGGADLWKTELVGELDFSLNRDMRAHSGGFIIYNGSFERRLQGTERFVNGVAGELGMLPVAVNLSSHEMTQGSAMRIANTNLSAGWFETWLTKYASPNPKSAKNQSERIRDFNLAEQKSQEGIPLILGYAYDFDNVEDVESMIAAYLVAKNGDSLKLHPMPISVVRQDLVHENNYFLGEDFNSQTSPATWGFSVNYLFEGLQKHRRFFEVDMGNAVADKQNISAFSYLRKYENGIALFNIGDAQKTVFAAKLNSLGIDINLYENVEGSSIKMPIVLGSMIGKVLVLK
jgi:hypothetical protein